MKRFGMFLAVAFLVTTAWSSTVQAAPGWFTAKVCLAGIIPGGGLVVRLTDVANPPAFVCAPFTNTTIPREMLATTLTAMTADLSILVFVDPDVRFSEITRLFLQQ